MIRRPPRSTLDRSSAASDVYKRQGIGFGFSQPIQCRIDEIVAGTRAQLIIKLFGDDIEAVSYTHLRAHETVLDLVCRLLLEKKKNTTTSEQVI